MTSLERYPREYLSWRSMRSRCNDPRNASYEDYGARGITVCGRWARFSNFLTDVGRAPECTTIDRINNDGNYEPGNCRWATATQQHRNRRNNTLLTFRGETLTQIEWAERTGIGYGTISQRRRWGWSVEDALTRKPDRSESLRRAWRENRQRIKEVVTV